MTKYVFHLYVAGQTARSQAAEANLRALCGSRLPNGYELEVVDITRDPGIAEELRILATPVVVRIAPPPVRRAIGDLSDHRRAAHVLGLPDEVESTRREGSK